MSNFSNSLQRSWRGLLLIIFASLLPVGMQLLTFGELDILLFFAPLLFFLLVSLIIQILDLPIENGGWSFSAVGGWLLLALVIGAVLYLFLSGTWSAWLFTAGIYTVSLILTHILTDGLGVYWRILCRGILGLLWVGILVGSAEIAGRFSNEEFYSGVELVILWVQWLFVAAAQGYLAFSFPHLKRWILPIKRWYVGTSLLIFFAAVYGLIIFDYQRSFYPDQAPQYAGIDDQNPFLCGDVPASSTSFQADTNRQMTIDLIRAKADKQAPEFALLALLTDDETWAEQFRQSLLEEAAAGNYTHPAGSVKYGQYLAAIRIYYFLQVQQVFPKLFSAADLQTLQTWFWAINQRAQAVEPVDWLYALAFAVIPQGPYINQDIGAGLLALLETNQLADPSLRAENLAYLDNPARGWSAIFRNTDDSLAYQQIWSENAWFQAEYDDDIQPEYPQQGFDWLLNLALPYGGRFNLNPYQKYGMYGAAHLAAHLLKDPRFIWLEGASLQQLQDSGDPITAYIGLDQILSGEGVPPQVGSCLMYGSSGVPDRSGPLAPDKVVLRNGWDIDSLYLLLNLRFTGWHRYKATNSISLIYAETPLVLENSSAPVIPWLPTGRQQFRDKRIPRENLNGMVIPVQGMQAVNRSLAGLRSPWAQDPPFYASVEHFETGEQGAFSVTRIENWHGWQQTRQIHLLPEGVIVVRDQAQGPQSQSAGIFWQLFTEQIQGNRGRLQNNLIPAEVLFVSVTPVEMHSMPIEASDEMPTTRLEVNSSVPGMLDQIAVFLTGEWVGAKAEFDPETQVLMLDGAGGQLKVRFDELSSSP